MIFARACQPKQTTPRNHASKKERNLIDKKVSYRVPFLQREKAAYLILRRVGCSINLIAKAFGRSTSIIHKILVKAQKFGYNLDAWCRPVDLRKLPRQRRLRISAFRRFKMFTLLSQWESWICGEEGEPP